MSRLQKLYFIISFCFFASVSLVSSDEGDVVTVASGLFDKMTLLLEMITYGALFVLCIRHRHRLLAHARFFLAPAPIVFLAVASTLWSIDPSFSIRRGIVLVCATIWAFYLGVMFDPGEIVKLYRSTLLVMMGLSLLVIVLLPAYGISHGVHGGDWKGSFGHKNRFGEVMALVVMTFGIIPTQHLDKWKKWGIVVVALGMLYKSHSGTPLAALAVVLVVQAVWRVLLIKRKPLAGLLLTGYPLLLAAVALIYVYSSSLLALLGKDATLTGRDRLWAGVMEAISQRPLLGYGYLAFWVQIGGSLTLIAERTSFVPPHAHNGYLNTTLHIGLIGLALFFIFFAKTMWVTIREGRRTRSPEALWFFSFLFFMFVINLTESQILEPFSFLWTTLVTLSVTFSVQRANRYREAEVEEELVPDHDELIAAVS